MQFYKNEYLLLILRLILGIVFLTASVTKIADPHSFAASINSYRILPYFIVNIAALTLPWIELICGILIILGISVKENAFILNCLIIIFIINIAIAMARGLNIECGCFGSNSEIIGFKKLFENSLLLISGLLLQKFNSKKYSLSLSN